MNVWYYRAVTSLLEAAIGGLLVFTVFLPIPGTPNLTPKELPSYMSNATKCFLGQEVSWLTCFAVLYLLTCSPACRLIHLVAAPRPPSSCGLCLWCSISSLTLSPWSSPSTFLPQRASQSPHLSCHSRPSCSRYYHAASLRCGCVAHTAGLCCVAMQVPFIAGESRQHGLSVYSIAALCVVVLGVVVYRAAGEPSNKLDDVSPALPILGVNPRTRSRSRSSSRGGRVRATRGKIQTL